MRATYQDELDWHEQAAATAPPREDLSAGQQAVYDALMGHIDDLRSQIAKLTPLTPTPGTENLT